MKHRAQDRNLERHAAAVKLECQCGGVTTRCLANRAHEAGWKEREGEVGPGQANFNPPVAYTFVTFIG